VKGRSAIHTTIEILSFAGCPHREATHDLVLDVVAALGVEADVRAVEVRDAEAAARLGFPGSPTVRIDGIDLEPDAAGAGCLRGLTPAPPGRSGRAERLISRCPSSSIPPLANVGERRAGAAPRAVPASSGERAGGLAHGQRLPSKYAPECSRNPPPGRSV